MPNLKEAVAVERPTPVLFATSWCGYCKKAREYMRRNGIAYVEYDIEKDGAARAEYLRYKGRGVPFLVMGDETLRGYTLKRYNRFFK
ncbi:MAG: glutaredoxin family protein [Gammaproteobacteria bacterium]|nr:glutaredoxin family protein [Gammaproteobacteria bacterium]